MKPIYFYFTIFVFLSGAFSCNKSHRGSAKNLKGLKEKTGYAIEKKGVFKDNRDGKEYKTVTVNGKVWLAQNFAYQPSGGTYWTYKYDKSNVLKHGYLYDWNTAVEIAPSGWRLPTKNEANIFMQYGLKRTCGDSGQLSGKVFRNYEGEWTFIGLNTRACCWTSTKPHQPYLFPKTFVYDMNFDRIVNSSYMSYEYTESGLSVRYVKE